MADIASGIDTLSLQKLLSACPDLRIICHILYIQSFGNWSIILKGMLKSEPELYKSIPENENAFKWLLMYIDQCAKGNNMVVHKKYFIRMLCCIYYYKI